MFNLIKKEEEVPQFRIEDNRLKASLEVYRGEKCLGHLLYKEELESWVFVPFTSYTLVRAEDLLRIARKLEELNDGN